MSETYFDAESRSYKQGTQPLSPVLEKLTGPALNPHVRDMLVNWLSPTPPCKEDGAFEIGRETFKFTMRISFDSRFPNQIPWVFH